MEGFARYENYKDSGVPWLEKIPSHWQLRKSKYLWREVEDRSVSGNEQLLSVSQYSGITPRDEDSRSESLVDYKQCKPDDLIVNIMLAWLGALGISQHEGIVSPAYCVYRQTADHYSKFLGYLYCTSVYLAEFARRSKGVVPSRWRMYTEDFGQIPTLLPPLSEQQRIAAFLDQKTAEIDEAIDKKQRLIELLQEQKAILISQAVTKGLNPNVPMRDSGVEWIGEIPEHWEVKKVKHLSSFVTSGPRGWAEYYTEEGSFFLQSGNLNDSVGIELEKANRVTPPENAEGRRTRLRRNDVLVCVTGANTGRVALSNFEDQEVFINQHLCLIRPTAEVEPSFLAFSLHSSVGQTYFFLSQYGLKEGLGLDDVKSAIVLEPPLLEQQKISTFIAGKLQEFDVSEANTERQIDKLRELKSVLISHAVTGKIKV